MAKSKRRAASGRTSQGRTSQAGSRSGATAPSTQPGETALRTAVAGYSRAPVVWLSRQPRFLIPGVMLILMLVGLAAPLAFAIPALILIFGFVGWLAFLSWPVLDGRQRAIRALMLLTIAIALVGRIAGWF